MEKLNSCEGRGKCAVPFQLELYTLTFCLRSYSYHLYRSSNLITLIHAPTLSSAWQTSNTELSEVLRQVEGRTGVPSCKQSLVVAEDRIRRQTRTQALKRVTCKAASVHRDVRSTFISWGNFFFLPEAFNRCISYSSEAGRIPASRAGGEGEMLSGEGGFCGYVQDPAGGWILYLGFGGILGVGVRKSDGSIKSRRRAMPDL